MAIKSYNERLSAIFSKMHIATTAEMKDYARIEGINTELRKIADDEFCRNFKVVAHRICIARKEKYINTYEMLADKAKKLLLGGINSSDALNFFRGHICPKTKEGKKMKIPVCNYERALTRITEAKRKAGIAFNGNVYLDAPEYYAVVEALEKQIPKKPLNKTMEYNGDYGECPCCGQTVSDYEEFKMCKCGQALDWSDGERKENG